MNTIGTGLVTALLAFLLTAALLTWWMPNGQSRSFKALPTAPRSGSEDPSEVPEPGDEATVETPVSAGVLVELVAAMLDAGVPVDRSLTVLGKTVDGPSGAALRTVGNGLSLGLPWKQAWSAAGSLPLPVHDLRSALTFSAVSGAPSASALRAASAQVRRAEHRRAEAAAERLAVQLVVPLGLCSLPAFIAWGIVPVLIGLVPDFFG